MSPQLAAADVVIVYGAGIDINGCQSFGKDVILFQRHRSGPVYLQYEVISPRFLRQHTDEPAIAHIRDEDVVTDRMDEMTWRLRALCGLKNTRGTKVLCIGGPEAWAQPQGVVPELVRKLWGLDLVTVSYDDLGRMINDARADQGAVALAKKRAELYLGAKGVQLETQARVCRQLLPLGPGVPPADDRGRHAGHHHLRLHEHDHAEGGNRRVPDVEHLE